MSNTIKNSIILGLVFLLISGFSYYWLKIYKGKDLKDLTAVESEKQKELEQLNQLADKYDVLIDSLNGLTEAFYKMDKVLPSYEDSKVSLEYFNTLASMGNSYINFTFRTGSKQEFDDYLTTSYELNGEAAFYNLYNFIWKLENYKRLYNIQSLNLQEIKRVDNPDEEPESYIKFSMVITGFSSKEKLSTSEEIIDRRISGPITYNPFYPLVSDYIPPNRDNLLEVNTAVLQGLAEDRAFIADSDGNLNVMEVGDRVYLGRLAEINKAENQVVFILNKGGFIETVTLRLREND